MRNARAKTRVCAMELLKRECGLNMCSAIWQRFHLQHQRMVCVAGGVMRQKVVQHNVSYPCTVCTQPCKINSYHSGSLMQSFTVTNYHCDGIPCQHPRKFRTAERLGTQLMASQSFSNHGRPTFGVGRGYGNSIWQRVGINSYLERTGVSGVWTEKLLARGISNGLMADSVAANSLLLKTASPSSFPDCQQSVYHTEGLGMRLAFTLPSTVKAWTKFDTKGNYIEEDIHKSELLLRYGIQARDIRFSTFSLLYVRSSSIIVRLQHIKAIINCDSLVLMDSDHPAIQEFIPELEERLKSSIDVTLPFEFRALETMLMKIFTVLDNRLSELQPALRDVLNSLLDPRLFSVDRGELHILLHHSKSLSDFYSVAKDIESTLNDVLDEEENLVDMHLTHLASTGMYREEDDTEDLYNILETYLMQAENILSEIQKLRELIDQSESVILINLDSQRNIMLRLGLQLEMGMFSAAISGLIGMAFGMNLQSSLEENPYAFWVLTGFMVTTCGLLWRRLLMFVGKSLDRPLLKKLSRPKKK